MCNETLLQRIISNIRTSVNNHSLHKILAQEPLDYDAVKEDMWIHRETVGDFARRAYGRRLAKRFIGIFIGRYYI